MAPRALNFVPQLGAGPACRTCSGAGAVGARATCNDQPFCQLSVRAGNGLPSQPNSDFICDRPDPCPGFAQFGTEVWQCVPPPSPPPPRPPSPPARPPPPPDGTFTVSSQEVFTIRDLTCPAQKVIQVRSVSYGPAVAPTGALCAFCTAPQTARVRTTCNGRRTCQVFMLPVVQLPIFQLLPNQSFICDVDPCRGRLKRGAITWAKKPPPKRPPPKRNPTG
ncbi:hypothetical protein ABPG75_014048 [Micractinium tetrahymenae]